MYFLGIYDTVANANNAFVWATSDETETDQWSSYTPGGTSGLVLLTPDWPST